MGLFLEREDELPLIVLAAGKDWLNGIEGVAEQGAESGRPLGQADCRLNASRFRGARPVLRSTSMAFLEPFRQRKPRTTNQRIMAGV